MRKIYILILLLAMRFDVTAQQTLNENFSNDFPYLSQVVEEYAVDNFEYPITVDDVLKYWQMYKTAKTSREILTDRTIQILDTLTFARLEREHRDISFQFNDDKKYFVIRFKQDTLLAQPTINFRNPSAGYGEFDAAYMRNFFDVSMQRADSLGFNIARTYDEQYLFQRELYKTITVKHPEFWENRKQRKVFNTIVLVFENDNLTAKYHGPNFDSTTLPFYNEVRKYVANFAKKHDLARIIFYYMYD